MCGASRKHDRASLGSGLECDRLRLLPCVIACRLVVAVNTSGSARSGFPGGYCVCTVMAPPSARCQAYQVHVCPVHCFCS